jgi:glutamine synthetase
MFKAPINSICEYIWIGGNGEIRSKTRVIPGFHFPNDITFFPEWNYDGSSTGQADSNGNTEVILKPCAYFKDPLTTTKNTRAYIVLCDTYIDENNPHPTNFRYNAAKIFELGQEEEPWFGLEQEYFMRGINTKQILRDDNVCPHYCGSTENYYETLIAKKHLEVCLEAGLIISGINSEVSRFQWEFQIGPALGIQAADQLIVARYLLEKIAEQFNVSINYHPKPNPDINGSGCHINFSTFESRSDNGMDAINRYINLLEAKHSEHIKEYGELNHLRLTGKHETSSIDNFSWGIGTRNTSVRIPNQVAKDNCGYFEDRRPASNIDPYRATSIIFKTCCIREEE